MRNVRGAAHAEDEPGGASGADDRAQPSGKGGTRIVGGMNRSVIAGTYHHGSHIEVKLACGHESHLDESVDALDVFLRRRRAYLIRNINKIEVDCLECYVRGRVAAES